MYSGRSPLRIGYRLPFDERSNNVNVELAVTHTPKMRNEQTKEKKVALASESSKIHLLEHGSLQSIH